MMNFQQFDLNATTIGNGVIRLTQPNGMDDPSVIDLHPAQLRHLAEAAGVIASLAVPHPLDGDDDTELHQLQVVRDDDGTVTLYQTRIQGMGVTDAFVVLHPAQARWLGAHLLALSMTAKPAAPPRKTSDKFAPQSPPKCHQQQDLTGIDPA